MITYFMFTDYVIPIIWNQVQLQVDRSIGSADLLICLKGPFYKLSAELGSDSCQWLRRLQAGEYITILHRGYAESVTIIWGPLLILLNSLFLLI